MISLARIFLPSCIIMLTNLLHERRRNCESSPLLLNCVHSWQTYWKLTLLTGHWNRSCWLPTLLPWLDELSSVRDRLFVRAWAQSPVYYTRLDSSQVPDNMDCTDSISLKSTFKTMHLLWAIRLNRQCCEFEEPLTLHTAGNNIRVQNRVGNN